MVSGYPIVGDVSLTIRVLYGMKLNGPEIDKAMAVADEL